MKQVTGMGLGVIAVAAVAAAGGYWLGNRGSTHVPGETTALAGASSLAGDTSTKERKLLFYRNPMGLPDTSPTPKKDPMGMDYIAVYAGRRGKRARPAGQIRISTEKVQKLGVRTEAARLRTLDQTVRAAGRIEADERRTYAIAPKFEGYVERLHVNVTGQPVSKGQPLFEVYSPELVSAQREYAIARCRAWALKDAGGPALSGMQQLAESSLQRLRELGCLGRADQGACRLGRGDTHPDLPLHGVRHRDREKGGRAIASCPARCSTRWRTCLPCGSSPRSSSRTSAWSGTGAQAQVRINAYPDSRSGARSLCLSDPQGGDPHGAGPRGTGQSRPAAQTRHVRPGRGVGIGQRHGDHRAGVGGHRQRHTPDGAGPAGRGPLRAARLSCWARAATRMWR
jgi:hypothetical protein